MDYLGPVKNRLDEFVDYLESIESFFEQEDTKLNDFEQSLQANGEELMEAWVKYYWLTTKKNLMRMSLFLSLYAFFEASLHQLCEYEQILKDIVCLPTDIKGNGIDRSRVYLTKIIGVDFPTNNVHWQNFKKYQKLRNHLAHKGLNLQSEDRNYQAIIRIIQDNPNLQMGEGHSPNESHSKSSGLSEADIAELKSMTNLFDKKSYLKYQGFLGDRGDNFSNNNIRFHPQFCREVINTIESFWRELITNL